MPQCVTWMAQVAWGPKTSPAQLGGRSFACQEQAQPLRSHRLLLSVVRWLWDQRRWTVALGTNLSPPSTASALWASVSTPL